MSRFWAKLPLYRKLILSHPKVQFIWWMDSDTMFTDIAFESPYERYKQSNPPSRRVSVSTRVDEVDDWGARKICLHGMQLPYTASRFQAPVDERFFELHQSQASFKDLDAPEDREPKYV
ncbi:hypothetical protein SUGI_0969010 [Cryptomeria japonica]|nr:hypothetical protein SUGI_0969010 [Cryptomeria japonica]